jgi:hypothetical protein
MIAQMSENVDTLDRVEQIINMLKFLTYEGDCVDGETMQYILERVGMDNQMLRQLIMSQPIDEVYNAYEERVQLERFVYKEK